MESRGLRQQVIPARYLTSETNINEADTSTPAQDIIPSRGRGRWRGRGTGTGTWRGRGRGLRQQVIPARYLTSETNINEADTSTPAQDIIPSRGRGRGRGTGRGRGRDSGITTTTNSEDGQIPNLISTSRGRGRRSGRGRGRGRGITITTNSSEDAQIPTFISTSTERGRDRAIAPPTNLQGDEIPTMTYTTTVRGRGRGITSTTNSEGVQISTTTSTSRAHGVRSRGRGVVSTSSTSLTSTGRGILTEVQRITTGNFEIGESSNTVHQLLHGESLTNVNRELPIRRTNTRRRRNCARNFTDTTAFRIHRLPEPTHCPFCRAKLFKSESSKMCCNEGRIVLPQLSAPIQLQRLFREQTDEAKHFRQYIRIYNHMFALTSMGVNLDSNLASGRDGVFTFRAQGGIYHKIGSLLPINGQRPRYLQMYIYDTEHEIENRMNENDGVHRNLVERLKLILDLDNAFVHFLRRLAFREDLPNCSLLLKEHPTRNHQYSLPNSSEVAAILVGGEDLSNVGQRQIIVQTHEGGLQYVPDTAGYYDPLQYPLLLPFGDYGWNVNLTDVRSDKVSCRAYYSYMLQIRPNDSSLFLRGGRLLQQYAVDNHVKIETQKLRYIRDHQKDIRAELYVGLQDSFQTGERSAGNVGTRVILPPTFIGSPRDMYNRYQDAMALVQKFGKPDLFITMTCNPTWDEITTELYEGQTPQDRADLTTRIFRAKCEELKQDIYTSGVLGLVVAHVHVIEFQKRGLPHVHMLVILEEEDKLHNPDEYDIIVRAEIPDSSIEPQLHEAVVKHMTHGPCGKLNPNSPCMKADGCKRNFPHKYSEVTVQGNDSYPVYRRRQNGQTAIKNGKIVDNRWVVPYNPWLLKKYNCHINVEICSSIKSVKYLYKYIHKGPDRVSLEVRQRQAIQDDEISKFVDGRWICPQQALWRIYKFSMNKIYPYVLALQIHLPNMQQVRYYSHENIEDLLANENTKKTMLTEFFEVNKRDPEARQLLYREFPEKYSWNQKHKWWTRRGNGIRAIGRIYTVPPLDEERFYLRILLNHVRGPLSFDYLLRVNEIQYTTYKESAEARGLLESDQSIHDCLTEAAVTHMPAALRRLFATILLYCKPVGVRELWDQFKAHLSEDYASSSSHLNVVTVNRLLLDLNSLLQQYGKSTTDFDLPPITMDLNANASNFQIIEEELSIPVTEQELATIQLLNSAQMYAFNKIREAVDHGDGKIFFIDGPGGTGKFFLYIAILSYLRNQGHIAIATASSGIAATILPGGRTAHSRFKIPLNPLSTSTCRISKQSATAELLRRSTIILWDEAPMMHRHGFEAFDRTMRDIMEIDVPFGNKIIILGGDFRQVLPVVPRGTKSETVDACINKSDLWEHVHTIRLTENMRARGDPIFTKFLLDIGDGVEPIVEDDFVKIPEQMVIPWIGEESLTHLINEIFPRMHELFHDWKYIAERALMAPTNESVDNINHKVVQLFPGEEVEYYSFDTVEDDDRNLYQQELLNSLCPSGLPPHQLILKLGTPIILLRNIDPKIGLCNGCRLICRVFDRNVIQADIITGQFSGTRVFLPRIPLKPPESANLPFNLIRKQFPIRLSFAMTINKAQGQTIPYAGVFFPNHVFGHGQLYVALSRGVSMQTTKVLVQNGQLPRRQGTYTKNVVYKEVLLSTDA